MVSKLTLQSDILETAMQAAVVKNDVILNNIANVDTPGFKKRDVIFDEVLDDVLRSAELTGNLELDKAKPKIKVIHPNFSYRIDDNNVDIEVEMVDLYQNSMRYDTMANSVINNYKRINLVIRAR